MSAADRLLEAAEALVAERGPGGLTLREAARRAEVSHAAPGYLFGDLRGLVTAVAVRGLGRFAARMEAAEQLDLPPLGRLLAIGEQYVGFARDEPQVFRLMAGHGLDQDDAALARARERSFGPLHRQLAAVTGTEASATDLTELTAFTARLQLAWSTVHGLAVLIIDGTFRRSERDEQALVTAVLAALGPSLAAPLIPDAPLLPPPAPPAASAVSGRRGRRPRPAG